jgi:hypothetical protein
MHQTSISSPYPDALFASAHQVAMCTLLLKTAWVTGFEPTVRLIGVIFLMPKENSNRLADSASNPQDGRKVKTE